MSTPILTQGTEDQRERARRILAAPALAIDISRNPYHITEVPRVHP